MDQPPPMLARYVIPDMPSADELLPYLREIDTHRWYSNFGPMVTRFEQRLSQYLSSSKKETGAAPIFHTTAASCYHALQMGLQLFRMPPNARVLVPAVTFPACPHAVHHAAAQPVLADIDPETWQLTPEIARRVAAKMQIHAVMPVAVYGVPVPTDAWDRFTLETGIPVIIDAAAALEAQDIPQHALVAFSLHATKPFSIGEGGLLASRDRAKIDDARSISNFGTHMRITLQNGVNGKISEYAGAVALAQLERWEGIKKRRRDTFALYKKAIEATGLKLTFQKDIDKAIVSTVILRMDRTGGAAIVNALNAQGIAAHRMYLPPLYHHPYFAGLTVVNTAGDALHPAATTEDKIAFMTNSEAMHQSAFGLPFHSLLQESDVAYCMKALTEVIGHPR